MEKTSDENIAVIQKVIRALTTLDIPYALGGSWASSFHGRPRLTQDADITAGPFPGKEAAFCAQFGSDYYISQAAVVEAVRDRTSFNIIHLSSSFKVDIFVQKERLFDQSFMSRRCQETLPESPNSPILFVSAEDIILLKLEWYRLGDESSERQWLDILEVMKTQRDNLDQAYLDHWAVELKVPDLLAQARKEINE